MAATFGQLNKAFVSSIAFLDKREIMDFLVDKTNEELTFMKWIDLMNRSKVTVVPEYHFFENEELFATSTVSGAVTDNGGPTGTDITFDVTDANGTSFLRPGDLVLCPNLSVGYVKSVTADAGGDIVNLISPDGATNMALADTNVIVVIGEASGEGSNSPKARKYSVTKNKNNVQVWKEAAPEITDIQNGSHIEFNFKGQPKIILKAQHDSYVYFQKVMSLGMMFGQGSGDNFSAVTNAKLVDADGNQVSTTKSLLQYARTNGVNLPGATVNLAFFKTLNKQLNARRVGKQYSWVGGTEMCHAFDDFFQALGSANLADAARFNITGRDVELGINSAEIYGRRYYKTNMDCFDDPFTIAQNTSLNKSFFLIPMDKAKAYGGGETADRIRTRYIELPKGSGPNVTSNGRVREIITGGLAPGGPTNEKSVFQCHYHAVEGLEVIAPSHLGFVTLS